MTPETLWWVGFVGFILAMLALDLGVFHRRSHEVKLREALIWTGVWVSLALLIVAGILTASVIVSLFRPLPSRKALNIPSDSFADNSSIR